MQCPVGQCLGQRKWYVVRAAAASAAVTMNYSGCRGGGSFTCKADKGARNKRYRQCSLSV